ncbi:NAD-dependent epimerase/dehydratase family protein [Aeromicrobium sp. CTD01-1L150]|uniref:NAD-dependent epimerase/dehydratase family protein n=1 Tax=Aeromicrobium sp. CTD01-1L150 TaxID=3341830 RepID=UPI0035C0657C
MRVMVTGGLGVNGAWLARELIERGHEVSVVETRYDTTLIPDIADQVEVVVGDISDADGLTASVRTLRPEVIVHLAAMVDCERYPHLALDVNVKGTANVATAALAADVRRVVYTSSKAVYAPATGRFGHPTYAPIAEDEHLGPIGMYGITKHASENVLAWYARTTELECVSLRFGTIFGPGRLQRHSGPINTYSSMIELPASGQPFTLEQGGEEGDDLVYVLDVADSIATVALAPEALRHPAYNIAAGHVTTLNTLGEAVRTAVPGADLTLGQGLNPMEQPDPYYMALDGSRIADELDWRPRFDIPAAVDHFVGLVRSRVA